MLRSDTIRAIAAHLTANYEGPVQILTQDNDSRITPPCAVVRIGSAEDIGMGQADVWDMNILIGVFHDADATTITDAESAASAVFAKLADPDSVMASLTTAGLIPSGWARLHMDASVGENGWQHVAAFRLVISPGSGN